MSPASHSSANRIGVMHLIDTLALGGAERMAVNLVNHLPRDRFRAHLCSTRSEGALANQIKADVGRLQLNRRRTLEWGAVRKLVQYIRSNHIMLLHAHGTSLFMAAIASVLAPSIKLIWHDHFGGDVNDRRSRFMLRLMARKTHHVIVVAKILADWDCRQLGISPAKIHLIPNFVDYPNADVAEPLLPGSAGRRIVQVANFRPQKDHLTALAAMKLVLEKHPGAHLILVGSPVDDHCFRRVRETIHQEGLQAVISILGERDNISGVLSQCDMGILSSKSEGLPLVLLEYGMAKLPVVVTAVGQCSEMIEPGRGGILVAPGNSQQLAAGITALLDDKEKAKQMADHLHRRVQDYYSKDVVVARIIQLYEQILIAI